LSPFVAVEEKHLTIRCYICGNAVNKISVNTMKKMLDDFPKETLYEWMIEMKHSKKFETKSWNVRVPQRR